MITFIESGNRIATENFEIGEIYTITFTSGNYRTMCCIGIGTDFVMFQGTSPNALFCLTLGTAETVTTIELGGGGSGTMNYNELENKPQINGVILIGNKTASDLNLVSHSDLDNYVTDTELTTELADYATNASVVSALASKQDTLTPTQLTAVNSGITSSLVTQITTNQNNISSLYNSGQKNHLSINTASYTASGSNRALKIPVDSISGTIHIYFGEITSTDTDDTTCGVLLLDSNDNTIQTVQFGRGTNKDVSVYVGNTEVVNVSIYPATNWTNSADDTVTITNAMICSQEAWGATGGSYEPYAMSNAVITAWIIAHS